MDIWMCMIAQYASSYFSAASAVQGLVPLPVVWNDNPWTPRQNVCYYIAAHDYPKK